jgi:transposase
MDLERTREQKRGRRSFEKDFKLGAVKMVFEGGKSVREVAESLGISQNTLLHWKKNYLSDKLNSFPGKGYQKPEDAEKTMLRKELAKVTEQRDILKKAVAFFSQYQK